ncbi:MAG: ribbon-helix-helix protein, CopG family [Clostridia bacterium]|nr:ribbon-helix-helix protein, CopG family [Clostridia bacterium]
MTEVRKIQISLPENTIDELDKAAKSDNSSRSALIAKVVTSYLRERRKSTLIEQMKKGYPEMAKINLDIATECFASDQEAQEYYEQIISECE